MPTSNRHVQEQYENVLVKKLNIVAIGVEKKYEGRTRQQPNWQSTESNSKKATSVFAGNCCLLKMKKDKQTSGFESVLQREK